MPKLTHSVNGDSHLEAESSFLQTTLPFLKNVSCPLKGTNCPPGLCDQLMIRAQKRDVIFT